MLRRDLLHGLVATQRFQRHLGLKLVLKFRRFAILVSLQRFGIHLSRLSGFLGPLQVILRERCKALDPLAHVCHTTGQIDPDACAWRDMGESW